MPFDPSQATTTINGVACAEIVKGYEESNLGQGPDITKQYLCSWVDRFTVANGMLGFATVTGGKGGGIKFHTPLAHPESPNAYVTDVRIVGVGRPYQGPRQLAFDSAIIVARFTIPQWGLVPDPEGLNDIDPDTTFVYATQEIDHGETGIEFKASCLVYEDGTPLSVGMSIPHSHSVMRITFLKMPYLPVSTLPLFNNLNNQTFLGCARGLVQFKGSATRREFQSDGSVAQTVTNTYHYRPFADWNLHPNPTIPIAGNKWVALCWNNAARDRLFGYSDLTQTFPDPAYIGTGV